MDSRIREVLMKKIWRIPIFLLLIIILGVSVVAGAMTYTLKPDAQGLIFEVSTDKKTYEVNETITIQLKIINPTFSRICLDFSSAYQMDYTISDQTNNQLYRLSGDKVFAQILTTICIGAFSSHTRIFNHTPEYYPLESGNYIIEGVVVGYFTDSTEIKIS